MMSAPSRASRRACERPWPRATPVMNATLPCRMPMSFRSWGRRSAGHEHGDGLRAPGEAGPEPDLLGGIEPELAERADGLDRRLDLPAGQVGSQAAVDTGAERQV